MRAVERAALDVVPRAKTGERRQPGAHASDRRAVYEMAVLRCTAHGRAVAT
jgi:hypothetical protein